MNYTKDEFIDVKDTNEKWCQAKIKDVTDNWIEVHYLCWSDTFDEKIPKKDWAERIQYGKAYTRSGEMGINQRIDIYDTHLDRWLSGWIREVNKNGAVVHYNGYHSKFDELIEKKSWRIQPYGLKTKFWNDDVGNLA